MKRYLFSLVVLLLSQAGLTPDRVVHAGDHPAIDPSPRVAYLVSDIRIPFWHIMSRGLRHKVDELGYESRVYSAGNSAREELVNTAKAIRQKVSGIIVSPTNSSACATILKLAGKAGIPVVVADVGADSGDYVSYVSSDNYQGAYEIGRVLAARMIELGWRDGRVGIVAIPQKRENGKARTAGFMRALDEAGIRGSDIKQQVTFSYRETYDFSRELLDRFPDLRAIWLQGSNRYQGALDAIRDAGREGEVLVLTFDAEPEFVELIPRGVLLGSAMQQPYLMGRKAMDLLHRHLRGERVEKNHQLPVLAISSANIEARLPMIQTNVLGQVADLPGQ